MLLFLFAKEKVTKKKNRGLVIFFEQSVLGQGQWYPKIPDAAFRTVLKVRHNNNRKSNRPEADQERWPVKKAGRRWRGMPVATASGG